MIHSATQPLFRGAFIFFIIFSLLLTSQLLVFAQETTLPNANDNISETTEEAENPPYELGAILIQYDETLFRASVNEGQGGTVTVPGNLLDNTDIPVAPVGVADEFLKNNGIENPEVISRIESLNTELVNIGEGVDPLTVINQLKASPVDGILLAQPNFIYTSAQSSTTPDPRGNKSWHLKAIQLKDAWDVVNTKLSTVANPPEVVVGVIDTGIDFSNTDLSDTKWSPSSCKDEDGDTVNGGCTKGGYDVHGFRHDNDPLPENGSRHGTLVASVLAGKYNNGYGGIGVAQGIKIAGVRTGFEEDLSKRIIKVILSTADVVEAIDFAKENEIDIINLSLGAYTEPQRCNDFKYVDPKILGIEKPQYLEYKALKRYGESTQAWNGGLAITSAGNKYEQTGGGTNRIHFPSDFSSAVTVKNETSPCWTGLNNVISVGGTELQNESEKLFEVFTNPGQRHLDDDGDPVGTSYGDHIDVTAPARSIAVDRKNTPAENTKPEEERRKEYFHGTSAAAPQVAGVAALMLQVKPTLTPLQIKTIIRDSADILPNLEDRNLAGGRRLNAYRAVKAALGEPTVQFNPIPRIDSSSPRYLSTWFPSHPSGGGTDSDGDGLIEIANPTQLSNIRHSIGTNGYKSSSDGSVVTTGCPEVDHDNDPETDDIEKCTGFELANDIDLNGFVWTPIGTNAQPFDLIFDGNNHTISNLSYSDKTVDHVGLFGAVKNATIRNLTLTNASVTGNSQVGILAGTTSSTTITNVGVQGTVTGKNIVGGLIGYAPHTHISTSYAAATTSSTHGYAGGMIGQVDRGSITNSYTTGTVKGSSAGGMYGYLDSKGTTITKSYAAVIVNRSSASSWYGGRGYYENLTVNNSYHLAAASDSARKTAADLKAGTPSTAIFTGWSTDVWDFAANKYPLLAALNDTSPSHPQDTDHDNLLEVDTVAELQNIHKQASTECPSSYCLGFELTADLDLTGTTWTPIGTNAQPFDLIFDGNNHTISNLSYSDKTVDHVGLFGAVKNATIRNLTLTNASVTGNSQVGILAGTTSSTTITNVGVQGTVTGKNIVGGLIGYAPHTHISTSYAAATTSSTHGYAGGMIGQVDRGSITNSYTTGTVKGSSAGGMYGYLDSKGTTITKSYAAVIVNRSSASSWYGGRGYYENLTVNNSYHLAAASDSARKTAADLKAGTPSTAIFTGWSTDVWDFGTATQLPVLKSVTTPILTISPVSGGHVNATEDDSGVTISGTTTGTDSGSDVDLTFTNGSNTVTISDITVSSNAWSTTLTLANLTTLGEGTIAIAGTVDNTAGRKSTASRSFVYDITAPTATASGAPTGTSAVTTLNVTVAGTDVTHYKHKVVIGSTCTSGGYGSETLVATAITDDVSSLASGSITLCVLGKDTAGNWQPIATSATWTKGAGGGS